MTHVTMNLEDFGKLVRGVPVRCGPNENSTTVHLASLDYPRMIEMLLDAAHGLDPNDGAERATVPSHWAYLAEGRMYPEFWLAVAPRAYDMIAEGMDEDAAVLAAIEEYKITRRA